MYLVPRPHACVCSLDRVARDRKGDVRATDVASVGVPNHQRTHRDCSVRAALALGVLFDIQFGEALSLISLIGVIQSFMFYGIISV